MTHISCGALAAGPLPDLDDLVPLLGFRPANWQDGDAALEELVLSDDGEHDEELCSLFYRRQIRHKATLGPPGSAMAAHHTCQPFRRADR
jgi:hypothetical protein